MRREPPNSRHGHGRRGAGPADDLTFVARGEETGLSDEEIAFYDALAENESAREAMGESALPMIAHELVIVITDWTHRDSARANIRRHVKPLPRKYGYPPNLQDAAMLNVLQQAEALSASWAA